MVVGRELEETGVQVEGIAAALQDNTAEIVGLDAARRSTPILEGMDVAEAKMLQTLVEKELQPQGAACPTS